MTQRRLTLVTGAARTRTRISRRATSSWRAARPDARVGSPPPAASVAHESQTANTQHNTSLRRQHCRGLRLVVLIAHQYSQLIKLCCIQLKRAK